MPDYTFHTLSPIDFENLVRDLLQAELSIRLENFKVGKDGGIDLRYSKADETPLIVQAKHYADTGFHGLLSHLKTKEKSKIDRINPDRYLLVTSVPLSPANKDDIKASLFPHIKGTEDIYGKDDLNNLLGLFPAVERQHFKLWLTSTNVLEEVLHGRIINQTKITLQDINDKARLYVANQSFNNALDILGKHNYVVIAGIPGIGKTTLAKMLVLHYLRADFEFIDVSYDISEATSIPDHHKPRVYLYDDFLGRTSLAEKLRKNEDHRLFSFIASVRNSKSAKLILTTREYILKQAQVTYEILNGPIFEKPQCIVDLSQYTRPIRAQILYNHLYFSTLPREHIEAIVHQAAFLKIIDHANYNPRIVEYMTDPMWVECEQPNQYPAIFLRNLQEPFLIWEQAFSNHLTDTAREMLLVLGTLPREVFLEDLELAAKKFVSRRGADISEKELRRALSELQGNFVVLKQDQENDVVSFHNPSVLDFLESYLEKNPSLYEALGVAACFFEQVQWLSEKWIKNGLTPHMKSILLAGFHETLFARPCTLINYSTGRGHSTTYKNRMTINNGARLNYLASLLQKSEYNYLEDIFRVSLKHFTDQMINMIFWKDDLLRLVKHVMALKCVSDLKDSFLAASRQSFCLNSYWISDVTCLIEFLELCPELRKIEDEDIIAKIVGDIVDNHLDDNDPQKLSGDLSDLEEIEKKGRFSLHKHIESVRDRLSIAEENCPSEEDYDDDRYRGSESSDQSIENETLTDMFSTLLR